MHWSASHRHARHFAIGPRIVHGAWEKTGLVIFGSFKTKQRKVNRAGNGSQEDGGSKLKSKDELAESTCGRLVIVYGVSRASCRVASRFWTTRFRHTTLTQSD